jgi:transposase
MKTFGILFGRRVGGYLRRAEEVIAGELAVAPELPRSWGSGRGAGDGA